MPQSTAPLQPQVNFVRPEVAESEYRWSIVRDCLGGARAVKSKGTKYLPMPNPADTSKQNKLRYNQYKERAQFFNVVRRTIDGWIGQVFSRDPIADFPSEMNVLWSDIDGQGASIDQQAKQALGYLMGYGRGGLLIDYPEVTEPLSISEIQENNIRPTITLYPADAIINWRMIKIGAVHVPSLVVLREMKTHDVDGFTIEDRPQVRVLRLTKTAEFGYVYSIEVWIERETSGVWVKESTKVVKGPDGKPISRILFQPMGILKNTFSCDLSPAYDLAEINIGHYRNSADYEESCFIVGQPTPVFAGLTQEWVEEVFKGTVEMGSRAAVPLPVGGTATLLQVNPNTMTKEAMVHKEGQMVALGARIIKDDSVQKTLGESQMEETNDSSILATAAKNVSAAYSRALAYCGYLMGLSGDPSKYKYSLNTDFPAARLTPNERAQLVAEWQAEAITQSEMRAGLRRAGIATLDTAEYEAERKKSPPPADKTKMQQGQSGQALNQGSGGGNQAGS